MSKLADCFLKLNSGKTVKVNGEKVNLFTDTEIADIKAIANQYMVDGMRKGGERLSREQAEIKAVEEALATALVDQQEISDLIYEAQGGKPENIATNVTEINTSSERVQKTGKSIHKGDAASQEQAGTDFPQDELVRANQQERIEDFGEHLAGAKKDLWQSYRKAMSDELPQDASEITLSKHFPEPDYENLIAAGVDIRAIAAVKAMRDAIPAKPRKPYKLRAWADNVKVMREFSNGLISGEFDMVYVLDKMGAVRTLQDLRDRIELYAELGYPAFKNADGYEVSGEWTKYNNETRQPEEITQWAIKNPKSGLSFFSTREEAVNALRDALNAEPEGNALGKSVKLDIYRVTKTGEIIIGKKVGTGKYIDLKGGFDSARDARQYIADNEDDLLKLLEQKKEVRPERRGVNEPRVGKDYRQGEDVTPEKFASEFGWRGVQFGNYVEQSRRSKDLNNSYDALLDMAATLEIPSRAVSLNGTLGLAFGARGSGGKNAAAAHFEPEQVVINLTKREGAGSLGHEWFHALANYFSRMRGDNEGDITTSPRQRSKATYDGKLMPDDSVRTEVLEAFDGLVKAIRNSDYYKRSVSLDTRRSKDYWSTTPEMTARAFETYLITKAEERGESNDYLANIVSEEAHQVSNEMFGEEPYPYPTKAESVDINKAFDKLFGTLKTKETEKGIALYSQSATAARNQHTISTLRAAIDKVMGKGFAGLLEATGKFKLIESADIGKYLGDGAAFSKAQDHADTVESPYRMIFPKVRGGWTKEKIRKALKGRFHSISGKIIHREIAKFDTPEEFAEHIFYHGTGGHVSKGLKPSIIMSERQAEQLGGGGYGERYWAISLSKSKAVAQNFTGQSRFGTVYPVVLKKGAKVISMPDVHDAAELENMVEDLWNRGIDAVRIGEWSKEHSEQELAVLNPQAIFKYEVSESFQVFNQKKLPVLTDEQIAESYKQAIDTIPHLDAIRAMPKEERDQAYRDLPNIRFSKDGRILAFVRNGETFLVADNISSTDDNVKGLLGHEIGWHALQAGRADPEFKALLNQLESLRKMGNKKVIEAFDRVPTDTPANLVVEEAGGYLIENHHELSISQKLIAWFKVQMRKIGKSLPVMQRMQWFRWADKLTTEDIVYMAQQALKSAPQTLSKAEDRGTFKAEISAQDQTKTAEFKKWFGDSKIVDDDGNPLVVYHGTDADFNMFDANKGRKWAGKVGFWFADNGEFASLFGEKQMPVYLSIKNPKILTLKTFDTWREKHHHNHDFWIEKRNQWETEGYDGIVVKGEDEKVGRFVVPGTDVIAAFKPEQIKSATKNIGTFDPSNPDIRFSKQQSIPGATTQQPVSQTRQNNLNLQGGQTGNNSSWDSPEPSILDDVVYKLQDKHIDLKRVIQSIRETGTQLSEKWDAYLQEELFHGRAAKRVQDFVNTELKPLLVEMQARGLKQDELDEYLHARHAKEANALIAQRDPSMPDGGSGMTNQEADDYFANLPADKLKKLEAVAKRVDAIIAKTRETYVGYSLISRDTATGWEDMFKHYVPLMREDHDGGMGIGQGFSIKGKEVKHRTGSTAAVVDILANIAMQREKAIVRGEKNRVAVSLAGLVKLNPNPDFWTLGKVPTERVLNEKTGLVEERIDPMFKSRENVVVAKIKDNNGQVHERAVIFNTDNDRAMRMAEAIKNLDASQLNGVLSASAKVTRYFASINTQYNPVFGVTNLVRDVQGAILNLSSTPLAKHKKEVFGHILSAARGIYIDVRAARKGTQSASSWSDLWEELQKEGGMTGYRDLYKTSADRAKAIEHELDPHGWVNSKWGQAFTANGALKVPLTKAQDIAAPLFDWLSDYNMMMEGATRLAVYKVAIDNGLSKQHAASLAKTITVNFNRKGQIGQQAGALYAFFNASMQGTARIGKTVFDMDNGDIKTLRLTQAGKSIVYGGVLLGAMQALTLAAAGFDDDDPPEFVRERSLIIPIGDKKYITIPMPLGFHVLPNIGRIPTEFAMGGFRNPVEHIAQLIGVFAEAFNPIGSSGVSLQTVMPTALDPFTALAENRDWTGKTIYKGDFNSMKPTPGFNRNKDTATYWSRLIAEGINTIAGGDKYSPGVFSPTADQIDYLVGQFTGGVGREISKLAQTGESIFTGEELPPHKMPLVGRFYGNSESQSSHGNRFYSNLKEINQIAQGLEGRMKDRQPVDEFKKDNPKYRLIIKAKYTDNIIGKLRDKKRELARQNAPKEKIKQIEDRITSEMAAFNSAVAQFEEAH